MASYRNLSGKSGVRNYEVGSDFIEVQFQDGKIYLYNYSVTGSGNVEHMKRLATSGSGLNSFINTNVRKRYAERLR